MRWDKDGNARARIEFRITLLASRQGYLTELGLEDEQIVIVGNCYRDCKNPITRFNDAWVFGNTVWWETGFENGSAEHGRGLRRGQ